MRLRKLVSFAAALAVSLLGMVATAQSAAAVSGSVPDPVGDFSGASGNKYLDIVPGVDYSVTGTGGSAVLFVNMQLNGSPYKSGTSGPLVAKHWLVEIYKGTSPVAAVGVDGQNGQLYAADGAASNPFFFAPGAGFTDGASSMSWTISLDDICVHMAAGVCTNAATYFSANDLSVIFATSEANSINGAKDVAPSAGQWPIQFLTPQSPPTITGPLPGSGDPLVITIPVEEGTKPIRTWTSNVAADWTVSSAVAVRTTACANTTSCVIELASAAVLGQTYTFSVTATNGGGSTTQAVTVTVFPKGTVAPAISGAPTIRFEPASLTVKEGRAVASTAVVDGVITSYSSIVCTPNTGVSGKLDAVSGLPVISGTPTANGECTVLAVGPGGTTRATFYYTVLALLKVLCNASGTPSTTTGIVPGTLTVSAQPVDAGGRIAVSRLGTGIVKANLESFAGGKLTYQAGPGFSGNSTITLIGSLNGDDTNCTAPVVINPDPAFGGYYGMTGQNSTNITWVASQNATGYVVTANGTEVCRTPANVVICDVKRLLGPKDQVQVQALGNDGTKSVIIPAMYRQGGWIFAGTVNFASGQSAINAGGAKQLQRVLALLERAGFTSVKAVGNTDGQGGAKGAVALSKARVAKVTAWLQMKADVSVTPEYDGNLYPIASNGTKAGQALNRRVDIWVR